MSVKKHRLHHGEQVISLEIQLELDCVDLSDGLVGFAMLASEAT